MEIVRKAKPGPRQFQVAKSFYWNGSAKVPGESIEIGNDIDSTALFQLGKIIPTDVPKEAIYVALAPLRLPGNTKAHECKKMERIILRDDQAVDLMKQGLIVPADSSQWRPFNKRLRQEPDRSREKLEKLEQAVFDQHAGELGIGRRRK